MMAALSLSVPILVPPGSSPTDQQETMEEFGRMALGPSVIHTVTL